jgi:uncharacterized radical SAM superfamily Fe-S cluster-containing enzyme
MNRAIGDYMYYGFTRSVCAECNELVNAQLLIRDEQVVMRKFCPQHGHSEVLVATDVDWAFDSRRAVKPPDIPLELSARVERGCPLDCGLCPDHQQHTCFAQVEVTNACDLDCTICYTGQRSTSPWFLDRARFEWMVDRAAEREGGLNQLAITGGEPSLHPEIIDFIRLAKRRNIDGVLLFTNGLRIARDDNFARALADTRPSIYLSFDGFNPEVYKKTRGRDLLPLKLKALERLERYNISVILVPAIVPGINEDQLGPILDYLFKTRNVLTVQIQPVFSLGSCTELDLSPLKRMTLTGVMQTIEAQTNGQIKLSDFMYVPCHHPLCGSTCYILMDDQNKPLPLSRFVNVDQYLDYITNRSRAEMSDLFKLTREAVEVIASASAVLGQQSGRVEEGVMHLLNTSDCCGLDTLRSFRKRMKQISIHAFMDHHSWDQNRVQKCCVHTLLPDGRVVPFCNYNIFHRNTGDAWTYEYQLEQLAGESDDVAGAL